MKKQFLSILTVMGFLAAGGASATVGDVPDSQGLSRGFAGQFLSGHFAQSENDWANAGQFVDLVLKHDPENQDLLKRAMILAMGAGDLNLATRHAENLLKQDESNSLAWLIKTVSLLAANDPPGAAAALAKMPEGDITDFVRPVVKGWTEAAQGRLVTDGFNMTTIHSYSGALIALHLGKNAEAASFIQRILDVGNLSTYDLERAGDLSAAAGDNAKALEFYKSAYSQDKKSKQLEKKIALLSDKKDIPAALNEVLRIKIPAQGVAVVLNDLARILFQEYSDGSARVFSQMAIALDPEYIEARLLLANALARSGRYNEAISFFSTIGPEQDNYFEVQHYMADLLDEAGQTDKALALLNDLFIKHNDVEALIRIGDIYRSKENYGSALKAYNRAAGQIGKDIPEEYWYLLYARGMVYEREGEWNKAEADLKAALVYRPDHPYLLNYLGYAWADQGVHLDESLGLLERASSLRPDDGFIKDSLGWVKYMMGKYVDAVPNLEKAVELMPYDPTLNDHLGDAYWQVGRKIEARFQWERAYNYAGADDEKLKESVTGKLEKGLAQEAPVKEAHSGQSSKTP